MKRETKPFKFLKKTKGAWAFSFLLITMFANVPQVGDVDFLLTEKIN